MQIKRILAALTLLLATASLSANATVKVNNLFLVKSGQFTELTIACDGKCEFTHQIVEEAANKPYRIVVDIKDAVHDLPQHAFANLPTGMVKQIRTSQFSTDPEKVVRVVIDAVGSLTYKVNAGDNGVTLFINTPSDQNFSLWSALPGTTPAPTLVKNDPPAAPATMPAFPGNEQNAPKVDQSDPAKQDLKLAVKPIDEGKLLNKPRPADSMPQSNVPVITQSPTTAAYNSANTTTTQSKPEPAKTIMVAPQLANLNNSGKPATPQTTTPAQAEKQSTTAAAPPPAPQTAVAQKPAVKVDTKVLGSIYGEDKPAPAVAANTESATAQPKTATPVQAASESKPSTPAAQESKTEPAKVADSAVIPQLKNPATTPANQPSESIKPPKDQKSGLPDVKVNPKPKFADEPSANPLDPKLATALKNDNNEAAASTSTDENGAALAQENAAPTVKSKSDAVREKYQASRDNYEAEKSQAVDSAALAQTGPDNAALSKIDKIRLKYKRGIKFVQNEEDEQEIALDESDYSDEGMVPAQQVGPYNEFLPEREIVMYTTGGRMDPFEPLVEDAQKTAGYDRIPDVESLRLVGILMDKKSSRALFEDANGYSYILQTGDRVKNGFVLSIAEDRVVFQIRQYGWNRQVALDLEETH
ncbi:MAG: AMIN domain-containing protein [Candidatus Zixiibacteriota bacterium]